MAFNTGNAVPSTDGRDLSDNAQTIDDLVNGTGQTTTARLGKGLSTINNLEQQYVFTAINNGVWAAGQTFTAINQYMVFTGTAYKPKNSTTLPYVVGASPVGDGNVEVVANLSTAQGDGRYLREFATLAAAVAATDLFDGQSIRLIDRRTGGGGGSIWDVVLLSSVTVSTGAPDIGNIVASTGDLTLALSLRLEGTMSAKTIGAKAADNTFDNGPVMILAHELNATTDAVIAFPRSKFFFATTVPLFRSDTWFGGFRSITKGWGLPGGGTEFIWNGSAAGDGIVVAGISGSKVDPSNGYDVVENLTLENYIEYPEVDFQINHGMEFDASALTATTGYIRNIQLNHVSVEKCGSHNIVLRGDVFDVKSQNLTSRQSAKACFKTVLSTVNAGLRPEPDQINLFNPVLFAKKQVGTVTVTDAWACDGSGIQIHGGNIQGSLGFRMGFGCGILGTHIEHEGAGPDGSIGILVRGSWNQLHPKWVVGYKTSVQIGESGATDIEGVSGSIPLSDGKLIANSTALLVTANGARNGELLFGEIKDTTTNRLDSRGLAEFKFKYRNKEILEPRILTPNSTTPDVSKGTVFRAINTAPTAYTDFLGGTDGETITIMFEDNLSSIKVVGNALFDSNAKVDLAMLAFSSKDFIKQGTRWIVKGE